MTMNRLTAFFTVFLIAGIQVAGAGTAIVTILDAQGTPIPNEPCTFVCLSVPQSRQAGTSVKYITSFTTDANGQITITNASPGLWTVKPDDLTLAQFSFNMPQTNGTIYSQYNTVAAAGSTWPSGTVSYDINASDLRYALKSDVAAGSAANVFFLPGTNIAASVVGGSNQFNLTGIIGTNYLPMAQLVTPLPAGVLTNDMNTPTDYISLNGVRIGSEGSGSIAVDFIEDLGYSNTVQLGSATFVGLWSPLTGWARLPTNALAGPQNYSFITNPPTIPSLTEITNIAQSVSPTNGLSAAGVTNIAAAQAAAATNGLGSAAFTASSAYDAANAAKNATNALANGAFTVNPLTSIPVAATNQFVAASALPFSPAQIPGLYAWLSAKDFLTPQTVTTWSDLSGNGH
ncbi:MAG: hypothetical protein KGL39_56945, partial [Patescibacteria group bacterium]|nr:hypothetical protein [Patescibacteria group bacterium]